MVFLPNIPQPIDQLSVSQANILNNFQILGAIAGNLNANSSSLNVNSGFNYINLPVQGANPPAGTAFGANVALYSFNNATTTRNELYINKTNNVGVVRIPATASILGASTPATLTSGWTYLPSGIILQWVTANFLVVGVNANPWPIAFPTQVLSAQVTSRGAGLGQILAGNSTAANWVITVPAGVTQAFIFGIGY